jgi:hypothetical protein
MPPKTSWREEFLANLAGFSCSMHSWFVHIETKFVLGFLLTLVTLEFGLSPFVNAVDVKIQDLFRSHVFATDFALQNVWV